MNQTQIKRTLVLTFLLSIYLVGLVQAAWEEIRGERPQCLDLFLHEPTQKNLRTYESTLEKSSWFSQKLQPWIRLFQFAVLQETGDKTLQGKDDWFYYRPGVRYLIEPLPEKSSKEVIPAILNFRDQLRERGIQLLLVPAPGKVSIYPDRLTSHLSNHKEPVFIHTRKIMDTLRAQGVEIFDLFTLFSEERKSQNPPDLYLSQDTHWAPSGLQLAARRIAQHLLKSGWVDRGKTDYEYKNVPLKRYGDILRMMDIPRLERMYIPQELVCTQVVLKSAGEKYHDDPASSILIIGDSFLRIFERDEPGSAGLISHLAYELHQPLASIVSDGGASTLVRQELVAKSECLRNKKVLIWEFVERDIRFGTEGWQTVTLRDQSR